MTIKKKYNEITNHLVIMLEKKKNTILIGGKNTFNNYKYQIRNYNLNVRSTLNLNFEERLNYSFFFFPFSFIFFSRYHSLLLYSVTLPSLLCLFVSVVAVTFHLKIYQNNIFFIF
jgi:hypothetical protein